MRTMRLHPALAVLILLLAGCGEPQPPETISALTSSNKDENFRLIGGRLGDGVLEPFNCVVTQLDLGGQPRLAGAAGGITVLPFPGAPSAVTSPETVGATLYDLALGPQGLPTQDVAILVIDDFNDGAFVLQNFTDALRAVGHELPEDPEGRSSDLAPLVAELDESNAISHGALVVNYLLGLIAGSGRYQILWNRLASSGELGLVHLDSGTRLVVKAVDTLDRDTVYISEEVAEAVHNLDIDDIVVNMSFALIPCIVKSDFEANRAAFPDFEAYLAEIIRLNRGRVPPADLKAYALDHLLTPFELDALRSTLNDLTVENTEGRYIQVSSAGNYGLDFPLFPAAWPEVVSVGAVDSAGAPLDFAHDAEIVSAGAWFAVTDPFRTGHFSPTSEVLLSGTSFSAPNVALFSALDLSAREPRCAGTTDLIPDSFDGGEPALALYPEARQELGGDLLVPDARAYSNASLERAYGHPDGCGTDPGGG